VALEAGVTHSTFSRVENEHMPDLETFAKLCKWLKRDPREFLGIEIAEAVPRQTRAALLLPREGLARLRATRKSPAEIAAYYGVSEALCQWRLRTTGVEKQMRRSHR
jgi:transcriptional regulator with XRE-family HTH domain